jgi:hypothetical protein
MIFIPLSLEKCTKYIRLLVGLKLYPIWTPVLPLNLTYIFWYFFRHCPERTCPIKSCYFPCPNHTSTFFSWGRFSKESFRIGLFVTFRNKFIVYGEELLAPRPTTKLENQPMSAVRDCLFNIYAATLRNLRTRHAVVTRDPHNMVSRYTPS